jgi:S1-C subfamily serine protease
VSDQIEVFAYANGKEFAARVLFVDHDSEMALLTVDDSEFFASTQAASIGAMPVVGSPVLSYSVSSDRWSRDLVTGSIVGIGVRRYGHSRMELLTLQTDARLGPGNSGAPVFSQGQLVGIAFQSNEDNGVTVVDLIPPPMIHRFLADVDDGVIGGVPELGICWQPTSNADLRKHIGISDDIRGILVTRVIPNSSADPEVERGDVVCSIDGVGVSNDGRIEVFPESVKFSHAVSRRQAGDIVNVEVWRNHQAIDVALTLKRLVTSAPGSPQSMSRYVIVSGVVFVPVTREYMETRVDDEEFFRCACYLSEQRLCNEVREVVVVSRVECEKINVDYPGLRGAFVRIVNGIAIKRFGRCCASLANFNGRASRNRGRLSQTSRSGY